jgi:hypothetical protein
MKLGYPSLLEQSKKLDKPRNSGQKWNFWSIKEFLSKLGNLGQIWQSWASFGRSGNQKPSIV